MRPPRAVRRVMLVACALGLALVPAYFGYQALAGVEGIALSGSTVSAPSSLTLPEARLDQASSRAIAPTELSNDAFMAIAAPAQSSSQAGCPSLEEAFAAIAAGAEGADIGAISLALAEVRADPTGAASPESSPLAQRLRAALGLNAASPDCPSIAAALSEAVQLAQIASAAEAIGPVTGSVGGPTPLSPSYSTIAPGTAGGARGHGYCADPINGCVG